MCGIVGYTGARGALDILMRGLSALAYRGYDSAGVALHENGILRRVRAAGKLENLTDKIQGEAVFFGHSGIGHTRWATHGAPTEGNAHPHIDAAKCVTVVHNGIIENERALRAELTAMGVKFTSETDTEVIPHLIAHYLKMNASPLEAIQRTLARLTGAYALAILFRDRPGEIYAVRVRSPLALAETEGEAYLASDVTALLPHTRKVAYPEEGEIAHLTPRGITLYAPSGEVHTPQYETVAWDARDTDLGGYRHFMEKEIHEVPTAIEDTLKADTEGRIPREVLCETDAVVFLACGSAYHAALLSLPFGEEVVGVRAWAEIASEFRYRRAVLTPHTLAVAVSQSGETADTLAALETAKARGCTTLAIVNVPSSAIARAADYVIYTQAGPEIAVATTKAYCAQVAAIRCMWSAMLRARDRHRQAKNAMREWSLLSARCREILASRDEIIRLTAPLTGHHDIFFIGRGSDAAAAREGALKLKEITYLHAEAFDAGELKHGTISLIEQETPVVALMTQPHLAAQMRANIEEVRARGAQVVAIVGADIEPPTGVTVYRLPPLTASAASLLAAFVLQNAAYEVAVKMNVNVDKPRNLAKSVTVE